MAAKNSSLTHHSWRTRQLAFNFKRTFQVSSLNTVKRRQFSKFWSPPLTHFFGCNGKFRWLQLLSSYMRLPATTALKFQSFSIIKNFARARPERIRKSFIFCFEFCSSICVWGHPPREGVYQRRKEASKNKIFSLNNNIDDTFHPSLLIVHLDRQHIDTPIDWCSPDIDRYWGCVVVLIAIVLLLPPFVRSFAPWCRRHHRR